jgi:hypothetical protein
MVGALILVLEGQNVCLDFIKWDIYIQNACTLPANVITMMVHHDKRNSI